MVGDNAAGVGTLCMLVIAIGLIAIGILRVISLPSKKEQSSADAVYPVAPGTGLDIANPFARPFTEDDDDTPPHTEDADSSQTHSTPPLDASRLSKTLRLDIVAPVPVDAVSASPRSTRSQVERVEHDLNAANSPDERHKEVIKALRDLQAVLVDFFPSNDVAIVIATQAGLNMVYVARSPVVADQWWHVVEAAHKMNIVAEVIGIAKSRLSHRANVLEAAYAHYASLLDADGASQ